MSFAAAHMDLDIQADRRNTDRRSDGVTARILRKVFSLGRAVDEVSARALFSGSGHDPAFIDRVLAIPHERRGKLRRTVEAPSAAPDAGARESDSESDSDTALLADAEVISLGDAEMAALHRLRFESETGMHRMTMAECPGDFTSFGLVLQECDGTPTITKKGRQTLRHFACVRALDSVRLCQDAIPMSDEVRQWLESNGYLERKGAGVEVTARGLGWLELHRPLEQDRQHS